MATAQSESPEPFGEHPTETSRLRWLSVALLLVAATVLAFWNLGDRGLWSAHEGRAARVAMTMLQTGEWVVPQLSPGEPTYQKPPLYYWLVAAAGRLTGGEVTPLATRLPSALATVLTVLVVYLLGRELKSHRAGLLAGVMLMTCARLMWMERVAVLDPLLMLWVTLTLYLFLRAWRAGRTWVGYLPAFVPAALGILTKGPLGVVVPGVVVVAFLAWEAVWRGWRPACRVAVRCLPGVLLCLAIAAPWFIAAHVRTGGDFTLEFFVYHHLCRSGRIELAETPGEDGVEPAQAAWTDYLNPRRNGYLVYRALTDRGLDNRRFESKSRWHHYLTRFWGNAFPWSVFLPGALVWLAVRKRRWKFEGSLALPLVWLAASLVLFSLMKFRKSEYLLVVYPALAVLVAVFLVEYHEVRGRSRFWDWLLRAALVGLCLFAVVLGAATLGLLHGGVHRWALSHMGNENDRFMFSQVREVMVGSPWAMVVAVAVMLGGFAWALGQWLRGRTVPAVVLVAVTTALVMLAYVTAIVPVIDRGRSHKAFVAEVAEWAEPGDLVIAPCGEDHELYYLLALRGLAPVTRPDGADWIAVESPAVALRRAASGGRGALLIVVGDEAESAGRTLRDEPLVAEPEEHAGQLVMFALAVETETDEGED